MKKYGKERIYRRGGTRIVYPRGVLLIIYYLIQPSIILLYRNIIYDLYNMLDGNAINSYNKSAPVVMCTDRGEVRRRYGPNNDKILPRAFYVPCRRVRPHDKIIIL